MADDLSCDFATTDAQLAEPAPLVAAPSDPWLARRSLGFGASDVPALLLAAGLRSADGAPGYLTDKARITNRTRGVARLFAEKAGIVPPLKVSSAADKGTAREREVLATWRTMLSRGVYYDEAIEGLVLPDRLMHADALLKSAWPLCDRFAPNLSATLDAWGWDAIGSEFVVEIKCSATARPSLPWWWRDQVLAQLAVTGADFGLLCCGEFWSAWHGNDGPIRVWMVERNEAEIELIREVSRNGWRLVECMRRAA